MVVTFGQQYNVGEKPTVILYTYINRHAVVCTPWPQAGSSLVLRHEEHILASLLEEGRIKQKKQRMEEVILRKLK